MGQAHEELGRPMPPSRRTQKKNVERNKEYEADFFPK